ncbi:sigma-E factor negative regulatory protein [Rhodoferax ferrireducens]|uniref:sigma-E factor negative regulatory protein n=1 Tax=Rhodoferax ferrireducens TaxID=192843 RepID=UPI000E0DF8D1|nr:sigma-E factor negative regulatory protein [Rhodoferax ferrireducens]
MMQEAVNNRELVSALVDGELRGDVFARTVEWTGDAEDGRLTWHAYHVVGDVLRSGEATISDRDAAFMQRLKLGLQQETSRVSRVNALDLIADDAVSTEASALSRPNNEVANDAVFRWKLLAGLASLAAVSVIGWQAVGAWGDQREVLQLAQVQTGQVDAALPQTAAADAPQVMIRDPQLDALLAAHRQFGGTSALQMPAGFLRNATFEGAAR